MGISLPVRGIHFVHNFWDFQFTMDAFKSFFLLRKITPYNFCYENLQIEGLPLTNVYFD